MNTGRLRPAAEAVQLWSTAHDHWAWFGIAWPGGWRFSVFQASVIILSTKYLIAQQHKNLKVFIMVAIVIDFMKGPPQRCEVWHRSWDASPRRSFFYGDLTHLYCFLQKQFKAAQKVCEDARGDNPWVPVDTETCDWLPFARTSPISFHTTCFWQCAHRNTILHSIQDKFSMAASPGVHRLWGITIQSCSWSASHLMLGLKRSHFQAFTTSLTWHDTFYVCLLDQHSVKVLINARVHYRYFFSRVDILKSQFIPAQKGSQNLLNIMFRFYEFRNVYWCDRNGGGVGVGGRGGQI